MIAPKGTHQNFRHFSALVGPLLGVTQSRALRTRLTLLHILLEGIMNWVSESV